MKQFSIPPFLRKKIEPKLLKNTAAISVEVSILCNTGSLLNKRVVQVLLVSAFEFQQFRYIFNFTCVSCTASYVMGNKNCQKP
jgi:hypothetical protein